MKTIYYLTGDRHTFKPIRVASYLTNSEALELMHKLKSEGKMAFCYNQGNVMKSADDFKDQKTREKYWSIIMGEYFG